MYQFAPLVFPRRKLCGGSNDGEVHIVQADYAMAVGQRTREDVQAAADGIEVGTDFDVERERKNLFFRRHDEIVRGAAFQAL